MKNKFKRFEKWRSHHFDRRPERKSLQVFCGRTYLQKGRNTG